MADGLTYREWQKQDWDRAHREEDLTALTGSSLDIHLTTLGATELFRSDITLLCIGVGVGSWIKEATGQVAAIWALDVSPSADRHLPAGVTFVLNAAHLPSQTFDLALSLWVAPHMDDLDLMDQLKEVIRSLKPNGVFALHYKEPLDENAPLDNRAGAADEFRRSMAAMMLRRRNYMDRLVERAGGVVLKRPYESPSPFFQTIEVAAHIGRKGDSLASLDS